MNEVITECGVPIRNLAALTVLAGHNIPSYQTFTFDALLNGQWRSCHNPCGNWAHVKDFHPGFVGIGIWELRDIARKENILP